MVEEGDEVLDALLVFQARIDHLGARNFRARILDVFGEGCFIPGDTGILVGVSVVVALDGAGPPPKEPQQVWAPGRVIVFRVDSNVPGVPNSPAGKAGHVYRVTDDLQLEEVGEFQLTIPNDTLAYRYGK